jgi:hypothetical protein
MTAARTTHKLSPLAAELAETLPVEPNGLSLCELADGLLGRRTPAARGEVRRAISELEADGRQIYTRRGDCEEFGLFDVPLYGLARKTAPPRARSRS